MRLSIRRTLAAAISLLFLAACTNRQASLPDTVFSDYVSAYSGGVIPENSTIRIQLARPATVRPDDGLFTFSPALSGSMRWISDEMIEFVPDQGSLQPGQTYKAAFALSKVIAIKDKKYNAFPFRFAVQARQGLLTVDRTLLQKDSATVEGTLTFSSPLEADKVREMIRFSWPDGTPVLHLSETKASGKFGFSVTGLARGTKDKTLKINFSDAGTGFRVNDGTQVAIPAQGEFKVLAATLVQASDPYVEVQFSDPVGTPAQGLVTLDGVGKTFLQTNQNILKVYFDEKNRESLLLTVHPGVRSLSGESLAQTFTQTLSDPLPKPAAVIPLQGNILPDSRNLVLPFRTISLRAVDLRVIQIYQDNVLTFLQDNNLNGSDQLRRSGRLVYSRCIRLDEDPARDLSAWQDWTVDLGPLFQREPGAIYRIRLTFKQDYSLYGSDTTAGLVPVDEGTLKAADEVIWDTPESYYWESWTDWNQYNWRDRDNPQTPSYYMDNDRFPVVNLMTSDIGLIAKYADADQIWVTATDLATAKPASGVELEAYNFQLRKIGSGKTDGNGGSTLTLTGKPFAIVGRRGKTVSYLKVTDGNEKTLSRFDVGGTKLEKGLKSFIYGERGVWRPGDTLHVTMILQDKSGNLPDGHPASLELYTPQGQFYARQSRTATDGFYAFSVPTLPEDPTGFWNAYLKVGGSSFHKSLRIESIKPNRLKIDLDMGGRTLKGGTRTQTTVTANWLTGPAAAGLPVKADMTLTSAGTHFKGYDGYTFLDPTKEFNSSETRIIDTRLDGKGSARLGIDLPKAQDAPGLLNATIVCSVEEPGGDASFTPVTLSYSPFDAYVGVKIPQETVETDQDHSFPVAVVDADGKRVGGHNLEYRIYKMEWRWWWESRAYELDSYVNGTAANVFSSGRIVSSASGDVRIPFRLDYPEWGRFLVYVKDLDSGHAAGGVFLADWPAYRGRSDKKDPTALTMLSFALDKPSYETGETATLYIPAAKKGRALVSFENGSGVIRQEWVATDETRETPYTFKVSDDMAPNCYVHITLLQPYGQGANDLPIRMYGVQPVFVNNRQSHLEPVISMADAVHPEEEFTVRISEKTGRTMTYTLALVDEGLLDLTAFKTPDPWNALYAREALGVRTWDLFDEVIGGYSGRFSPMFSVGGDQQINPAAKKDNRFNPVVRVLGPFTLEKGSQTHRIKLPMYVGSLRVMVVAGHDGAFGNAEKAVAVRSPLMVVPTLPRVLGSGEKVTLPVNVFAMENDVRQASVSVKVEGPVKIAGNAAKELTFNKPGDQLVRFELETAGEGTARVTVSATGAGHTASETISIQVRNPNPPVIRVQRKNLAAGEKATFTFNNAQTAQVTLTGFPAIDVNGAFSFTRNYRYTCTEQLAARGLTLLHTKDMLSEQHAAEAETLLPEIIRELYVRQLPDGGFVYWPGENTAQTWVSSMAGLFLSEAAAKGYRVERENLQRWTAFQQKAIANYRASDKARYDLDQAFRLYALALAGHEEAGAMNRLKEQAGLSPQARWMLAAAYAACGKKAVGTQLIQSLPDSFTDYSADRLTYGSSLRDKAIAINALALCDRSGQALEIAQDVAQVFAPGYSSTQEMAFAAMAMDRLAGMTATGTLSAEVNGKAVQTPKSVWSTDIDAAAGQASLTNTSDGPVYVSLVTVGQVPAGTPVASRHSGLRLEVTYTDLRGAAVDPRSLQQGTEFTATIKVTSENSLQDLEHLALTFPIASGWEIYNDRLFAGQVAAQNAYDHQDIRDDACIWYFDLPLGTSKTFKLRLRAAYEGSFLLPPVTCEAMYDSLVATNTASGTAVVTR